MRRSQTAADHTIGTATATVNATTTLAGRPSPRTTKTWPAARLVAALLAAAALGAGCSNSDESAATPPHELETPKVEEPLPAPEDEPVEDGDHDEPDAPDVAPVDTDDGPARVARATDHLDVTDGPESTTVLHRLEPTTSFDSPRALLVVDERDGWLEVLLPVRPNGTTGWVRLDDVEVVEVDVAVEIDLDARELSVLEAGEVVLTTTVAIGDADHPTPVGTFSVTDKLDTGDPNGPYGPFALGLSGRSDVLTEFAGGDGQIGIHGTNDPSSIGQAASHGCIRVPNDVVEELARLLPLGTPVTVS